jgi:hypothetical protein
VANNGLSLQYDPSSFPVHMHKQGEVGPRLIRTTDTIRTATISLYSVKDGKYILKELENIISAGNKAIGTTHNSSLPGI